jgi:Holliday junction DNA helicase RuvA
MFDYLRGIISKTLANYVVVDVNGVGYKVYTPNPYKFKEGSESIVYVYSHIREDENSLYGFANEEERELFLKLIDVKGLGPKMAMPILATGSISGIADAIDRENVLYLKKFPKIGEKLARQIILDLKGKLVLSENISSSTNDELILALESLGYKTNDIKNIVVKVDTSLPIESQIKEALKLLLK